ncbi:hypothetical protein AHAS_Ahas12G0095400 [Arachis hypogaea]
MVTIAEALSYLILLPSNNNHNTSQPSTSSDLPSQLQPNSKGSINAITLRSGTKLKEIDLKPTIMMEDIHDEEVDEEVDLDENEKGDVAKKEEEQLKPKELKRKNILEGPTPIPFPTVAKKAKKHEELDSNVVQIFKMVEIYGKLNLALLKWSRARFVLFDKSIVSVVGIAENMLVNIQDLTFPVDFHILKTPPIDSDRPSSIILRRPFLKTF